MYMIWCNKTYMSYVCACVCVCICVYVYIYIYIYIYIYTYMHTYTHTYIQMYNICVCIYIYIYIYISGIRPCLRGYSGVDGFPSQQRSVRGDAAVGRPVSPARQDDLGGNPITIILLIVIVRYIYIYIYTHMCTYIYIYIYIHLYTYIHIYIYIEREREWERDWRAFLRETGTTAWRGRPLQFSGANLRSRAARGRESAAKPASETDRGVASIVSFNISCDVIVVNHCSHQVIVFEWAHIKNSHLIGKLPNIITSLSVSHSKRARDWPGFPYTFKDKVLTIFKDFLYVSWVLYIVNDFLI